MGGRGASSGISDLGIEYGQEYKTVLKSGNVLFIRSNYVNKKSDATPMETKTKNRVYALIGKNNSVKSVVYFDNNNKRKKQIDLDFPHKKILPHTHHGYFHNENDGPKGATRLSIEEKKLVDNILKIWENKNK